MANYNVPSNEIQGGVLYKVAGEKTVTYNGTAYPTGTTFRGISTVKTFTYTGSGTMEVNEVFEVRGFTLDFDIDGNDIPSYPDKTVFTGMGLELELVDSEKIVTEVTKITGFGIELLDFPFYSFQITERRL